MIIFERMGELSNVMLKCHHLHHNQNCSAIYDMYYSFIMMMMVMTVMRRNCKGIIKGYEKSTTSIALIELLPEESIRRKIW